MKVVPDKQFMVGRIVDFEETRGGLVMPTAQTKGVSIFVLVDQVGPDVKKYKAGDIIAPFKVTHIKLRGDAGAYVLIHEDDVYAHVEDLPLDKATIDGKPAAELTQAEAAAPS